jgi:hypothetical protein
MVGMSHKVSQVQSRLEKVGGQDVLYELFGMEKANGSSAHYSENPRERGWGSPSPRRLLTRPQRRAYYHSGVRWVGSYGRITW